MNKVTNLLFMLLMAFVACSRAYHIYQFGADSVSVILLVVAVLTEALWRRRRRPSAAPSK